MSKPSSSPLSSAEASVHSPKTQSSPSSSLSSSGDSVQVAAPISQETKSKQLIAATSSAQTAIMGKKWKRKNKHNALSAEIPVTLDETGNIYSYASVFRVEADDAKAKPVYFVQIVDGEYNSYRRQSERLIRGNLPEKGRQYFQGMQRGKREEFFSGSEARLKRVWRVEPDQQVSSSYQHPDEQSVSPKTVFKLYPFEAGARLPWYLVRRQIVDGNDEKEVKAKIAAIRERQLFFHDSTAPGLYFYQGEMRTKIKKQKTIVAAKFYTFMPHQGQDFREFLKAKAKLNKSIDPLTRIIKALQLSLAVMQALQRFHTEKQHVHWDLKTENMLIEATDDPDNPWKITIIDCVQAKPLSSYTGSLAAMERFMATPDISAPEVLRAMAIGGALEPHTRQDVFSAGVTCQEIFAAFLLPEEGAAKMFAAFLQKERGMTALLGDLAPFKAYFAIIDKMCIKEKPEQRPTLDAVITCNQAVLLTLRPPLDEESVEGLPDSKAFRSGAELDKPEFQQLSQWFKPVEKPAAAAGVAAPSFSRHRFVGHQGRRDSDARTTPKTASGENSGFTGFVRGLFS